MTGGHAGSPVAVVAQHHGHLDVGIDIGPVVLRIVLLAAVPAVAAFAVLRGTLPEPGRRTLAWVVGAATGAATLELLLSGGLDLREQVVPLLLAALAVPMYLALSRDPRAAARVATARRFAAWVFWPLAVLALLRFGAAWFGTQPAERTATALHTGVVLGLVAIAWFGVARPTGRAVTAGTRAGAAVLAFGLVAGVAHAVVLGAGPSPGLATVRQVAVGGAAVEVVVVPNLPGWNLVHVGEPDVELGTDRADLAPARARPGTSGGWAAVRLPPGRGELWLRRDGRTTAFATDTGSAERATSPRGLHGPDGPECASALLGRMVAAGPLTGTVRCPADALDPADADALAGTVDRLAAAGHQQVAVYSDTSPRGVDALRTIRTGAARAGVEVVPPGRGEAPLLVVSGWSSADFVLRAQRRAEAHVAPWLAALRLTGVRPIGGDRDARFPDYTAALRAAYPTQQPSPAGFRAWSAAAAG